MSTVIRNYKDCLRLIYLRTVTISEHALRRDVRVHEHDAQY